MVFNAMANLIFGKIFASMFEGSMHGAGSHVFAVMSYVISHMQPDKTREEYVRLNPVFLAGVIGDPEKKMQEAIDYLCAPDKKSTSLGMEGRRLVLVSPYVYHVVNGKMYREIRDEEDRLAKAALRQQRHREKKAAEKLEEEERKRRKKAKQEETVINAAGQKIEAKGNWPYAEEQQFVKGVGDGVIDPATGEQIKPDNSETQEEGAS